MMATRNRLTVARSLVAPQRGVASVFFVLLLIACVSLMLLQTARQSAQGSVDSLHQYDSQAALLLAESGLERARALLRERDLEQAAHCESLAAASPYRLGEGSVTLSAVSSRRGQPCWTDCDTCTVSSIGLVHGLRRELSLALPRVPLSFPAACGGAGGLPAACPVAGIPAADWHSFIEHAVQLPPSPALLVTNLGFLRHPVSAQDQVYPAPACRAVGQDGSVQSCQAQWFLESSSKSTPEVVGSRGALVELGSLFYGLRQQLTADSLYAASAVTLRGLNQSPVLIGSYWNWGGVTAGSAGFGSLKGNTNNGSLCQPDEPVSHNCPARSSVDLLDPKTEQTARSWCWRADTMLVGFTGSSDSGSSGRLDVFRFGPDLVPALPIPQASVEFPVTDPVHSATSALYSSLLYFHNSDFLSEADVMSGARLIGSMGTIVQATLTKGEVSIAVNGWSGASLVDGDLLQSQALRKNTALRFCSGSRVINGISLSCGTGGLGAYDLTDSALRTDLSAQLEVLSNVLLVSAASRPYLGSGDQLSGIGVAAGSIVNHCSGSLIVGGLQVACGNGGLGAYLVAGKEQAVASTEIRSNGISVSTATGLPLPGTRLAFRSGTGIGKSNLGASSFIASAPVASGTGSFKLFDLAQRPATAVTDAQVCGGICALFEHTHEQTPIELELTSTRQWAAGFVCLSGVDPASISGVGALVSVPTPVWHERWR